MRNSRTENNISKRQAMKLKYTCTLLTLVILFYFVPANAQTKKVVKKATVKTEKKAAAKTGKKPAPSKQKTAANKLGDAVAKASRDTSKKGGGSNASAAGDKNGGSLSEEIVVTTDYKPVLADAVKIRRNPDLEDKTPFKASLDYTPLDKRLEQNTEIRQLSPMVMKPEQDSIPSNNYARVGIGNFKTTFGEVYINNGKDDALQVGGYLKHIAQSGTSYSKQNSSHEQAGIFGKTILGDNTLSGRVTYDRRGTNFYGYDPLDPPASFNPPKQHFNTIGAEGELTKSFKDVENEFTYALKLQGYAFSDAYQARENNLVLSGFLNETIKQFYAGVAASLDLSSQKDSLYSYNNSLVRVNPYLKFQGENYKIDAGVNVVNAFGFQTNVHIFPAAKLELQVIPKYVRLFAEAKGDVDKGSIRDFSETNPFVEANIPIKNSVDKLDITIGLKGTIAPGLGFKASIFRNSVKDLPLFVSNFAENGLPGSNRFSVIYDNGSSRINGFNGELDYKASDAFSLFGRVEFKDYQLASEEQAWNLPKFQLTAGTVIHINNKISINGTLLLRGNTYDRVAVTPITTRIVNINSFADLNGGVEYKINSRLSIFAQANNLLNTNNQTWLYYPNYGFNIFGGVGYHF